MLAGGDDHDAVARDLADAVPQKIQFEGTQKIAADKCTKGKAPKTCDMAKTCLWTANPTQALIVPDARCYPKGQDHRGPLGLREHPGLPRLRAQPGLPVQARRQEVHAQAQEARQDQLTKAGR
jgi:hypothetical protein